MLHIKQKNKGIGLLELMLSLAVIGILIVMVTIYFKPTSQAANINQAINMLQAIQSAGQRWLLTNDTYSTDPLSDFVDRNFLPNSFSSNMTNPWGGKLTVDRYKKDPSALSVEMDNLPIEACQALVTQAASLTCKSDDSTYISCDTDKKTGSNTFTILLPSQCPATL